MVYFDFILFTVGGACKGLIREVSPEMAVHRAHRLGYKGVTRAINFNL